MSPPSNAVFLSYASEDAPAVQRIADALRGAGIEVWFDREELRGGDVWDQKIRQQIRDCRLFVPIVSANTEARLEGYFRREWKLAVDRTEDMDSQVTYLFPVVIDNTPNASAHVPEKFRHIQWTRLPDGDAPPPFVERVGRLVTPESSAAPTSGRLTASGSARASTTSVAAPRRSQPALWVIGTVAAMVIAYFAADKFRLSRRSIPPAAAPAVHQTAPSAVAAVGFNPPPHSIGVLPFVNMSGDKEQEYFSDGLTEELLNSLARINELQVAARTSSFSFQGEHVDIGTVAHKLNVGAVLEGSVRRSARTVRVTVQLINGVTGFHVWSETYDRDLGDILKLQTEIATAVASALRVTLLGDVASRIELGGTRNPPAFDAYLRGSKTFLSRHEMRDVEAAISSYNEAIRLDPSYAIAFAARALAFEDLGTNWVTGGAAAYRETFEKVQTDARKAIALSPSLAEGHLALADALSSLLDFSQASGEFERAVALAPGNAQVLRDNSDFAAAMGRVDAGVAYARRAVLLDPLNPRSHWVLASALSYARQYDEIRATLQNIFGLDPDFHDPGTWEIYFLSSTPPYKDTREWCEKRRDDWTNQICLAIVYDKLGRHTDAEAELARFKAGNPAADDWYEYAEIYAQWGDTAKALSCLDKALSIRQTSLYYLRVDPLLDPLRKEPRFQAIERALKFPN